MHENRLIHRPACFCCSWYDKRGDYLRHAANESTRAPPQKEAKPASLRSAAPSKGRGSRGHSLLPMEGGAPKGRRLGGESGMKKSEEDRLKCAIIREHPSAADAIPPFPQGKADDARRPFRLPIRQRGSHERRIGCRRREDRVCLGFSSAPKGLSDSRHPICPSGDSHRTDRTSYRTNQRANHPKIKCQIPVIGYFASPKENL